MKNEGIFCSKACEDNMNRSFKPCPNCNNTWKGLQDDSKKSYCNTAWERCESCASEKRCCAVCSKKL